MARSSFRDSCADNSDVTAVFSGAGHGASCMSCARICERIVTSSGAWFGREKAVDRIRVLLVSEVISFDRLLRREERFLEACVRTSAKQHCLPARVGEEATCGSSVLATVTARRMLVARFVWRQQSLRDSCVGKIEITSVRCLEFREQAVWRSRV